MKLSDKAVTAWSNLGRRKIRTGLTSIGVVVGIMTIVTMISLVNGVRLQVNRQFASIGLDRVIVKPPVAGGLGSSDFTPFGWSERSRVISETDVARWRKWPEVKSVQPQFDVPQGAVVTLRFEGDDKTREVRIGGDQWRRGPFTHVVTALAGDIDVTDRTGEVVVSKALVDSYRLKVAYKEVLGRKVHVTVRAPRNQKKEYTYRISGVSSALARSVQLSTRDMLNIKSWWNDEPDFLAKEGYDSVTLRTENVNDAKALVRRLRKEKLDVQSIDSILDVANRIFSVIAAMLGMVSGVALLVAFIGIVNTMIMSIYERTREIGTLKAMGASRNDIRHLFMIEAGLIGLLGGVAGLAGSWVLAQILSRFALWYAKRNNLPLPEQLFVTTPLLAFSALAFAFFIGVVAGLYPANRAARLDPLSALRHE